MVYDCVHVNGTLAICGFNTVSDKIFYWLNVTAFFYFQSQSAKVIGLSSSNYRKYQSVHLWFSDWLLQSLLHVDKTPIVEVCIRTEWKAVSENV